MTTPPFLKNLSHTFSYGTQLKPARDWIVVVSIALIILAFSIVWNIFNFRHIVAEKAAPATTNVYAPTINKTAIQSVQQLFSERASEQTKYESGAYSFADPSK